MRRRAFVVVLDACGVGALPDAAEYGDEGANTLAHVARAAGGLEVPHLGALGLGSIIDLDGVPPSKTPVLHGRLHPLGPGKDTIAGHWELMGVITPQPLPTYPGGFPPAVIAALEQATGREILANEPAEGIAVLEKYGAEHLRTNSLIVYTSADSVLQIAAHVDRVTEGELHEACAAARKVMRGQHAVGRVIARPFTGEPGTFERTSGRRDFALDPPTRSYLEELHDADVPVHSVGKVGQVFNGVGVDFEHPGATNSEAIASTSEQLATLDHGFVFANLVETDQVYGHRQDIAGFHGALRQIDAAVARWMPMLHPEADLLILTADHGCDPTTPGTDHTREYAPLLALFGGHEGRRHDGPFADVGATVLRWLTGRVAPELPGESFVV